MARPGRVRVEKLEGRQFEPYLTGGCVCMLVGRGGALGSVV